MFAVLLTLAVGCSKNPIFIRYIALVGKPTSGSGDGTLLPNSSVIILPTFMGRGTTKVPSSSIKSPPLISKNSNSTGLISLLFTQSTMFICFARIKLIVPAPVFNSSNSPILFLGLHLLLIEFFSLSVKIEPMNKAVGSISVLVSMSNLVIPISQFSGSPQKGITSTF